MIRAVVRLPLRAVVALATALLAVGALAWRHKFKAGALALAVGGSAAVIEPMLIPPGPVPSVGLYYTFTSDPTTGGGCPGGCQAPLWQFGIRTDVPALYYKSGTAATAWTRIGNGASPGTGTVTSVGCGSGVLCTPTNPFTTAGDVTLDISTNACSGSGSAATGINSLGQLTCGGPFSSGSDINGSGTAPDLAVFTAAHSIGNFAGSACSAGSGATAIGANGALSCATFITGGGTTGNLPLYTGTEAIGNYAGSACTGAGSAVTGFSASGQVICEAVGSAGLPSGTGSGNFLARWLTASTLGIGVSQDNGSAFTDGGSFSLPSSVPQTFNGTEIDDLCPAGLSSAFTIDGSASADTVVTGMCTMPVGTIVNIRNLSTSTGDIYIANANGSATGNQFGNTTATTWRIRPGASYAYKETSTTWRQYLSNTADFPNLVVEGSFFGSNGSSGQVRGDVAASGTVPTIIPNQGSNLTGIGAQSSGVVSIIGGGAEAFRCSGTLCLATASNLSLAGSTSTSWGMSNSAASGTTPTFFPNRSATTTGIGAQASGNISLIAGGVEQARVSNGSINNVTSVLSISSSSWELFSSAASSTTPTLIPNRTDTTTGIGAQASGNISLIVGATEVERCSATSCLFTGNVFAGNAAGWELNFNAPSTTVPVFIPNRGDLTTGIGAQANGNLSLIASGVEQMRIQNGGIFSPNSSGPQLLNSAASSTVPTLIPNRASSTTGIGTQAAGNISLIIAGAQAALLTGSTFSIFPKISLGAHVISSSTALTVSNLSCNGTGTPAVATSSTDVAGTITENTLATQCTLTFAATYTNAPFCQCSPTSGTPFLVGCTSTATTLVFNNASATGDVITYTCVAPTGST